MSGGLRHHEDEVKRDRAIWLDTDHRTKTLPLSKGTRCVCAEVGSVFEIMKPRNSNYLTLADVLRDVEKGVLRKKLLPCLRAAVGDRKSTRLNSSHVRI